MNLVYRYTKHGNRYLSARLMDRNAFPWKVRHMRDQFKMNVLAVECPILTFHDFPTFGVLAVLGCRTSKVPPSAASPLHTVTLPTKTCFGRKRPTELNKTCFRHDLLNSLWRYPGYGLLHGISRSSEAALKEADARVIASCYTKEPYFVVSIEE